MCNNVWNDKVGYMNKDTLITKILQITKMM